MINGKKTKKIKKTNEKKKKKKKNQKRSLCKKRGEKFTLSCD
jgi:hypothetical protein